MSQNTKICESDLESLSPEDLSFYTAYEKEYNKAFQTKKKSKGYFYKYGLKFFYYLVKQEFETPYLLGQGKISDDSLIIAMDNRRKDGSIGKVYAVVTNRSAFFVNYLFLPSEENNFYEVISGHQKPHFDLDCNAVPGIQLEELEKIAFSALDLLINAIEITLLEIGVDYRREKSLITFDSCGLAKQSYHIVIDGWYHKDHIEAKTFYNIVMEKIKGQYNPVVTIDDRVYSSRQEFRLFGSQKLGSGRPKKIAAHLSRRRDPAIYTYIDDAISYTVGIIVGNRELPALKLKI